MHARVATCDYQSFGLLNLAARFLHTAGQSSATQVVGPHEICRECWVELATLLYLRVGVRVAGVCPALRLHHLPAMLVVIKTSVAQ